MHLIMHRRLCVPIDLLPNGLASKPKSIFIFSHTNHFFHSSKPTQFQGSKIYCTITAVPYYIFVSIHHNFEHIHKIKSSINKIPVPIFVIGVKPKKKKLCYKWVAQNNLFEPSKNKKPYHLVPGAEWYSIVIVLNELWLFNLTSTYIVATLEETIQVYKLSSKEVGNRPSRTLLIPITLRLIHLGFMFLSDSNS